jgi:hypothetical protein
MNARHTFALAYPKVDAATKKLAAGLRPPASGG